MFGLGAPGCTQGYVDAAEGAVELREIGASVSAAALGASQRPRRDQPDQRVPVRGQLGQPFRVALESGVTP
jgi:hypothetical protein